MKLFAFAAILFAFVVTVVGHRSRGGGGGDGLNPFERIGTGQSLSRGLEIKLRWQTPIFLFRLLS